MSERESERHHALEERYPGLDRLTECPELLKGVYTITQMHPDWEPTTLVTIEEGVKPSPKSRFRGEGVYGAPVTELLFPGEALSVWNWEVRVFRRPKLECGILENDGGALRFHRYDGGIREQLAARGVELRDPLI